MKLVINSSFKMLPQRTGLSLQSPLRPLSVLVFHLLLTQSCRGQSQMIGPPQPIVALVGDDIILPCHLEPAVDVAAMTLEWTRSDLNSIFVFVWRAGKDLVHVKDPSYTGRTSLFTDGLKHGNISLKLSKVKLSDEGRYKCYVADLDKESLVELVVASGAASYLVITLSGIDEATRGVMLDCRSEGWYPEPEVLWLDGEGNLLSAGPPETVRGPDDLYTVSSRVTVEKRHSNSFTCRVQQKNTNQTRETHIQVPDDFFKLQSSSVPVITGLAVCLAVSLAVSILLLLLVLFVVWKWRKNIIKTQRNHLDQRERETLMKSKLIETKGAELQQLHEEKKRNKNELQSLKEELEKKNKEMERIINASSKSIIHSLLNKQLWDEQQKKEEAERELKQLMTKNTELEDKQEEAAEAQLKKINEELKKAQRQLKSMKDESISQLMRENEEQ
ncbi:butyrophilin subfamily 3 member A2-like [Sebastes fasciatus]|uniref:butyrophilin subfamily 3 member A2-like n=1 Tax=Sebastes fasciatus TaxID=394691 RepID=UPI003D9F1970